MFIISLPRVISSEDMPNTFNDLLSEITVWYGIISEINFHGHWIGYRKATVSSLEKLDSYKEASPRWTQYKWRGGWGRGRFWGFRKWQATFQEVKNGKRWQRKSQENTASYFHVYPCYQTKRKTYWQHCQLWGNINHRRTNSSDTNWEGIYCKYWQGLLFTNVLILSVVNCMPCWMLWRHCVFISRIHVMNWLLKGEHSREYFFFYLW